MANELKSKRAALWLGGVALLVLGFLVAAVVLPASSPTPGADAPDVQVPKMENVPPSDSKMKLDLEKKE